MKKQLITLVALAGFAMGASIASGAYTTTTGKSNGGGIVASKHNMNDFMQFNGGTKDPELRICAFCHTPHHSLGTGSDGAVTVTGAGVGGADLSYNIYAPLWSRDLTALQSSYEAYKSATFNPADMAGGGVMYDPLIGPSRLCLTCHDGNIAVDSYYGQVKNDTEKGDDVLDMIGAGGHFAVALDKALTNDHPIGFRYLDFLGVNYNTNYKYELRAVATKFPVGSLGETDQNGTGSTIQQALFRDPLSAGLPTDGIMTCATCHDVHNGKEVGNDTPMIANRGYFLRGTQLNSYFCLTCHDKNQQ